MNNVRFTLWGNIGASQAVPATRNIERATNEKLEKHDFGNA